VYFSVDINAENVWLADRDRGETRRFGLYCKRIVQADDAEQAKQRAIDVVRRELEQEIGIDFSSSDPPQLRAEDVALLPAGTAPPQTPTGRAWYESEAS
jgi:hypothetical protein